MNCKVHGKIVEAGPLVQGVSKNGKKWMKREYLLEEEPYNKKMKFVVFKMEDSEDEQWPEAGQEVDVFFTVEAYQWKEKWYNEVRAFRVMDHTTVVTNEQ